MGGTAALLGKLRAKLWSSEGRCAVPHQSGHGPAGFLPLVRAGMAELGESSIISSPPEQQGGTKRCSARRTLPSHGCSRKTAPFGALLAATLPSSPPTFWSQHITSLSAPTPAALPSSHRSAAGRGGCVGNKGGSQEAFPKSVGLGGVEAKGQRALGQQEILPTHEAAPAPNARLVGFGSLLPTAGMGLHSPSRTSNAAAASRAKQKLQLLPAAPARGTDPQHHHGHGLRDLGTSRVQGSPQLGDLHGLRMV